MMGLHGHGIFGQSMANSKGSRRVKCPDCGKIEVPGSWSNRHPIKHDAGGKPYIVMCPRKCPKCGKLHYHLGLCPDCGYDSLKEEDQNATS
jgi:ssDNA-binding Zn-finger/Zn-ribbon topoisomerase 1